MENGDFNSKLYTNILWKMLFQMMYSFQIETQYNLSFGIVEKIFSAIKLRFFEFKMHDDAKSDI